MAYHRSMVPVVLVNVGVGLFQSDRDDFKT